MPQARREALLGRRTEIHFEKSGVSGGVVDRAVAVPPGALSVLVVAVLSDTARRAVFPGQFSNVALSRALSVIMCKHSCC